MKVSVLIPYYNDEKYLKQSIESVLNQTFTDFELILINHATTDSCREIAHSYNDSRIVHLDIEKNYGAGTGLVFEKSLSIAKGEYIKLFCADDVMYKNCLKMLVEYMDSHLKKDFAFGNVEYIDTENKSLNKNWFSDRENFSLKNDEVKCLQLYFNDKSFLPYIGSIVKSSAFRLFNPDKSFICYFDVSLWTSLLVMGCKIGYIDEFVAGWRIHPEQTSSAKKEQKLLKISEFEKSEFIKLFCNLKDENLFRQVFANNRYIKQYDNLCEDDLQFILHYEMLLHESFPIKLTGYQYIYNLLQDNEKAAYLESKFNFGIKEFRTVYSAIGRGRLPKFSSKTLLWMLTKNMLKSITLYNIRTKNKKTNL